MNDKKESEIDIQPIQKRSVSEEIISQLRILIESGKIVPGGKLPNERELSRKLNVSRPSLREALKALSLLGIIENRPGSGTYLTSQAGKWPIEPFSLLFILSKGTLLDIYETRRCLEGSVAALATARCKKEDLAVLQNILSAMEANLDNDAAYSEYEMKFHLAIIEISGNLVIANIMEKLYGLLKETRDQLYIHNRQTALIRQKDFKNHKKIFNFIKSSEPEKAAQAMIDHLSDFEKNLFAEKK